MLKKGGLYLSLGDSITWTSPDVNGYVYPAIVWDKINSAYAPIRHINKGYGGQTSGSMMTRFRYQMSAVKPDIVSICIGMNDCNNDATGVATFEVNLNNAVEKLRSYNPDVEIILCSIPPTVDPARTPYVAAYRQKIVDVSIAKGTYFADFSTAYDASLATYSQDGVHATNSGHNLLANILYGVIQTTNFVNRL